MRRPWNIIDSPIYSLASYTGEEVNMNICTYASAIGRKPKQYMFALDYKSHSYSIINKSDFCILQILSLSNIKLITPLGKRSGRNFDKGRYLEKKGLTQNWNDRIILKDISACIFLDTLQEINTGGDHALFIGNCKKSKTFSESNILMFQELVDQKVIL